MVFSCSLPSLVWRNFGAFLVLTVTISFANCAFAVEPPELRARLVEGQSVKIVAQTPRIAKRRPKLQLQKSIDGSAFHSFATVRIARQREVIFDQDLQEGRLKYRSRLLSSGRSSRWSNTVKVEVHTFQETTTSEETFETPTFPGENPGGSTPTPTPSPKESPAPPLVTPVLPEGMAECPAQAAIDMLIQINLRRAVEGGLVSLVDQPHLKVAARIHTISMAQSQKLTHDGWLDEILATGFRASHAAQNIANYIQDPVVLTEAFMDSISHRANILNSKDSLTGISCIIDGNGKFWWAQNFASAS